MAPAGSNSVVAQEADRDDVLDRHVVYYLKKHPEFYAKHKIARIRPGVYNLDGREITVDWHYATNPAEKGYLIAIDGPLQQPFDDYVQGTERNALFDNQRLARSALHQVPNANRLSFGDSEQVYSRLEAMKIAKEQAVFREKAAAYVTDGAPVPHHDLMTKYEKVIAQRLGNRWRPQPNPDPPRVAATLAAPPVVSPEIQQSSPAKAQQGQSTPLYCANHNASVKRSKRAPVRVECASCKTLIQTNYVDFAICSDCSQAEKRCMCCGAPAEGIIQPSSSQQGTGTPVYCMNHNRSEKRRKAQPRNAVCTSCQAPAQTNYVEFTLCHSCSQAERRCLCCGSAAIVPSSPSMLPIGMMSGAGSPTKSPRLRDEQRGAGGYFQSPMPNVGQPPGWQGFQAQGLSVNAPAAPSYTPQPSLQPPRSHSPMTSPHNVMTPYNLLSPFSPVGAPRLF